MDIDAEAVEAGARAYVAWINPPHTARTPTDEDRHRVRAVLAAVAERTAPAPTFATLIHRASVRNGLWVPWCAGSGWDVPLASYEHPEQVTCPLCMQAARDGAPPTEYLDSAGWEVTCEVCRSSVSLFTPQEIEGWTEGHRHGSEARRGDDLAWHLR